MLPFLILRCMWISSECVFLFLFFSFCSSLLSLFCSGSSLSHLGLCAWYWTLHKEAVCYTGRLYHHGGDPVGTPFPYSAMACACASLPVSDWFLPRVWFMFHLCASLFHICICFYFCGSGPRLLGPSPHIPLVLHHMPLMTLSCDVLSWFPSLTVFALHSHM